jgi:nucleoside-diphosphate-sugar epimerase
MALKRTLVTGAAGFTGRYIGTMLEEQGHEVHGLVHAHDGSSIPGYRELHETNLTDAIDVAAAVAKVVPDHVVHLAAISNVASDDLEQMYRVNLLGTRHLLDVLDRATMKPSAILLASSANIYGNVREGVLDEETPPAPANDYGVSKLAMEHVASIYRPSLPIITVRPFNYTGRGQSSHFLIPKIVEHVREGAPVIELGNLDVARDFSDVRMVADAYVRLINTPDAVGGTFNVCSGRAIALRKVVDLAVKLSGHPIEIRVNPALIRSHEVRSLHGSRARLEATIGSLRQINLEETLRWMLED